MLFRPIRELLAESLQDQVTIDTFEELKALIDAPYFEQPLQLSWKSQGYDRRCGWDTYIICAKMPQYDSPQAVGYTNGNPDTLQGYSND